MNAVQRGGGQGPEERVLRILGDTRCGAKAKEAGRGYGESGIEDADFLEQLTVLKDVRF